MSLSDDELKVIEMTARQLAHSRLPMPLPCRYKDTYTSNWFDEIDFIENPEKPPEPEKPSEYVEYIEAIEFYRELVENDRRRSGK